MEDDGKIILSNNKNALSAKSISRRNRSAPIQPSPGTNYKPNVGNNTVDLGIDFTSYFLLMPIKH